RARAPQGGCNPTASVGSGRLGTPWRNSVRCPPSVRGPTLGTRGTPTPRAFGIVPRQFFEALHGIALLSGLVTKIGLRHLYIERWRWFRWKRCSFAHQLSRND